MKVIQEKFKFEENPKKYGKVAVLMGGPYAEREVSLMSGTAVLEALQAAGIDAFGIDVDENICQKLLDTKPQRVFLAMHGVMGEDGTIQGLLETLKIPYTGSGILASALAMDKTKAKSVWKSLRLPVLPQVVFSKGMNYETIAAELGKVLAVKPIAEGSSVGVTKVSNANEFSLAIESALQSKTGVMIEPWIMGEEVTMSILADEALPVIRIVPPVGFYDYEAKYFSDETQFHIPSGLSEAKEQEAQQIAIQAYHGLGCRHWGRVDAIIDEQGKLYLLEVNTIPGLTSHSLVPQSAASIGINFQQLLLIILSQTL